jgi:hypothetical protein
MATALQATELARLLQINEQIRATMGDMDRNGAKIAVLLKEVWQARLYLATHTSFAAYFREVFGKHRSRAYQLLAFADLSTLVDTERHARELQGHGPEVQALALELAGENPTAAKLREALELAEIETVRTAEALARASRTASVANGMSPADRLSRIERCLKRALRLLSVDLGEKEQRLQEILENGLAVARE